MSDTNYLSNRNEFLFLYDIKMGNPNGDPDENRPRVLPDNTYYVTDVRLKRFIRDYLKSTGKEILVDTIEGKTTNLTGRVADYLKENNLKQATGADIVKILLDAFIDARLFGSSFAFKSTDAEEENEENTQDETLEEAGKEKKGKKKDQWEPKPTPKTLTGPVQLNMGEVLNDAEEIAIHGTSIFASKEENKAGTFTDFYGLRYGLIAFSGVANENSAKISHLSDADYELFIKAMWKSVRESGNTRTKKGQMPHFLLNIKYKKGSEFQFGRLQEYVSLTNKAATQPSEYEIDISKLLERIDTHKAKIEKISYTISDDCKLAEKSKIPQDDLWEKLDLDIFEKKAEIENEVK